MANRRDFLKMFGIGAAIAPILPGGVIVPEAKAVIVEPPKIQLSNELPKLTLEQWLQLDRNAHKVTCFIETESGTLVLRGNTFIVKKEYQTVSIPNPIHRFPDGIAIRGIKLRWQMEGEMIPDTTGNLAEMLWL